MQLLSFEDQQNTINISKTTLGDDNNKSTTVTENEKYEFSEYA